MPRSRIRSGVRTTINFLNRQIRLAKKMISEARSEIGRLKRVDKRVRRLGSTSQTRVKPGLRGRGPNIKDVAYAILSKTGKPMKIAELATKVIAKKRGRAGANFVQNLGAALYRDARFKRTSHGMYALRVRRSTKMG